MKPAFYLIALAMMALALAALLLPLIRAGRQVGRPRAIFILAVAIALLVPLSTAGLYLLVGTPATLGGVEKAPATLDIDKALAELRAHLAQQPNDTAGWLLLAQSELSLRQGEPARDAFDHVLRLDTNNAVAMVGFAEADAMARTDHRIEGRARVLLDRAVQRDPQNQRALWLLGIASAQQGDDAQAVRHWQRLLTLLPAGSSVATSVAEQIASAQARVASKMSNTTEPSTPLSVRVDLAPALRSAIEPNAVLYVVARAEHGSPMPLAVAKLPATDLPARVSLTDAMAMAPGHALSSAKRVVVTARISQRGDAQPQPRDLVGEPQVIDLPHHAPIAITINKVRP